MFGQNQGAGELSTSSDESTRKNSSMPPSTTVQIQKKVLAPKPSAKKAPKTKVQRARPGQVVLREMKKLQNSVDL